jgi:release factor glutamine methyltransferase
LILKEKFFMAFEMGWDQGDALTKLAKEHFPDAVVEVIKDMQGKDRMLFVKQL